MVTRASFIASLTGVDDVNAHFGFIDRHARDGDRATLKALVAELNAVGSLGRIPEWAIGAIRGRIVEALALSDGYDNANAALEIAAACVTTEPECSRRLHPAGVASKIAAAHSPDVLDRLLRNMTDLQTAALVLHEAVIRGKLSAKSPAGRETLDRLRAAKHPLARLPLTLLDLEQEISLPEYASGAMSVGIPFGPTSEKTVAAPASGSHSIEIAETTSRERANLISAAVINWKDESNGRIEARVFRVHAPCHPSLGTTIPRLGLESLGSCGEPQLRENAAVKGVFAMLFSAASGGGAYNSGRFAALGRLLAWHSLAGLVGALADDPLPEIEATALACQWCFFDSPTEWFYQVAWDIGIACFNPARGEIAILAATDTD